MTDPQPPVIYAVKSKPIVNAGTEQKTLRDDNNAGIDGNKSEAGQDNQNTNHSTILSAALNGERPSGSFNGQVDNLEVSNGFSESESEGKKKLLHELKSDTPERNIISNSHVNPNPKFQCSECWKSFYSTINLEVHVEECHPEKIFQCHYCDKEFQLQQSLRCHEKSHETKTEPFKCKKCAKPFISRAHWENHIKSCNHPSVAIGKKRQSLEDQKPESPIPKQCSSVGHHKSVSLPHKKQPVGRLSVQSREQIEQKGLPIKKRGRPSKIMENPTDPIEPEQKEKKDEEILTANADKEVAVTNETPLPNGIIIKTERVTPPMEVAPTPRSQRKRNPPKWTENMVMEYEVSYVASVVKSNPTTQSPSQPNKASTSRKASVDLLVDINESNKISQTIQNTNVKSKGKKKSDESKKTLSIGKKTDEPPSIEVKKDSTQKMSEVNSKPSKTNLRSVSELGSKSHHKNNVSEEEPEPNAQVVEKALLNLNKAKTSRDQSKPIATRNNPVVSLKDIGQKKIINEAGPPKLNAISNESSEKAKLENVLPMPQLFPLPIGTAVSKKGVQQDIISLTPIEAKEELHDVKKDEKDMKSNSASEDIIRKTKSPKSKTVDAEPEILTRSRITRNQFVLGATTPTKDIVVSKGKKETQIIENKKEGTKETKSNLNSLLLVKENNEAKQNSNPPSPRKRTALLSKVSTPKVNVTRKTETTLTDEVSTPVVVSTPKAEVIPLAQTPLVKEISLVSPPEKEVITVTSTPLTVLIPVVPLPCPKSPEIVEIPKIINARKRKSSGRFITPDQNNSNDKVEIHEQTPGSPSKRLRQSPRSNDTTTAKTTPLIDLQQQAILEEKPLAIEKLPISTNNEMVVDVEPKNDETTGVNELITNSTEHDINQDQSQAHFDGMPKLNRVPPVEFVGGENEDSSNSSSGSESDSYYKDFKFPSPTRRNSTEPYIKDEAIQFLASKISNRNMLRIRKELMALKQKGNYFKLTKTAPLAAGLIHDMFCIDMSSQDLR